MVVVGELLDQRHLSGALRVVAVDERVLVERLRQRRDDQVGGAALRGDELAVHDERPGALDLTLRLGDARDLTDALDQRRRQGADLGLAVAVPERRPAAEVHVRAGEARAEDVRERVADLIRDHERARHHGGAEQDRDRGQGRAKLVARHAAQRVAGHCALSSAMMAMMSPASLHGRVAHDQPVGQEERAVGDRRGPGVVRDHHGGLLVGVDRLTQHRQDLGAGGRVEVAGRLVGEDHGRP